MSVIHWQTRCKLYSKKFKNILKNKKLLNHFQKLKTASCLPSAFLISCSQSAQYALKLGTEILKMIHCPQNLECSSFCSACPVFEQSNHHLLFQFQSNHENNKLQIEELIVWSKIRSKNFVYKFVIFPNIENLSTKVTAPLLKWIENLPVWIIVLASAQQTNNIYPPLLSRFQTFDLNNDSASQVANFELFNDIEKYIFTEFRKSLDVTVKNFVEELFLPLVKQTELFFHNLDRRQIFNFLVNHDENLIMKNFWQFETVILLFAHGILCKVHGFDVHQKKWSQKQFLLINLIQKISQQLEQKQMLYNQTKNLTNVKLAFLELLASIQKFSSVQNISNRVS